MGKNCTCHQEKTKIRGKQALPLLTLLRTNESPPSALHRCMIDVWRAYACSINHYIVSFSRMLFLRNFERFNNWHAYHGLVGGNQLPLVNLFVPRMTGRNMRPHVIYFTKLAAITIKVGALLHDEGPWFFTFFSREEPPFTVSPPLQSR